MRPGALRRPGRSASGRATPSIGRILPRVLVTIAVVETVIMLAFERLRLPPALETLLDAGLLSLLIAPVLWLWIIRPLAVQTGLLLANERKIADAFRMSEERYRAIVDTAPDGILIVEDNGMIVAANAAAESMFGWPSEDLVGRDVMLLVAAPGCCASGPAAGVASNAEALAALRAPGGHVTGLRHDGTPFPLGAQLSVVHQGSRDYVTAIVRDLSEAVAREAELHRSVAALGTANAELVEARDRAEAGARAKAEFLATMSHEIRTPMNGVLGFTHLLLDTSLTPEQRDYITTIRNSGASLLTIINDILDFSKIEAGRMVLERIAYAPGRTLAEVVELLAPQARAKGIALALDAGDVAEDVLEGDEGRVRQVLINLVGNAIKFTPAGGVTLRARAHRDRRVLRIEIQDTGVGIPADKLGGLFQTFAQVDASTTRRFGGTGLGLAICRRLVELMDGAIGVESEEGRGSTFWFTLPLPVEHVALPGTSSDASARPRPQHAHGLRVLVAEDNTVNQKLARRLLEKSGCAVDVVGNGREAVEMARQFEYDLVIMDCHMPEMDGFAATRAIRERYTHEQLPIVALTASALKSDQDACVEAGMDDFLTKPIVPDLLERCVDRWAA